MSKDIFNNKVIFAVILMLLISACREVYTPRPRTFMRIDFPEKEYAYIESAEHYGFEYPIYGKIMREVQTNNPESEWLNIELPSLNGCIYLSYKNINGNLNTYIEDSRGFVYKHTVKAEQINETPVNDDKRRVFGIFYDIKGNTASSVQFFVTDSIKHFLRGSLYFNVQPEKDSLMPVIDFVREDVLHLINTLHWKE